MYSLKVHRCTLSVQLAAGQLLLVWKYSDGWPRSDRQCLPLWCFTIYGAQKILILFWIILFPNTFCRIFDSKIFLKHSITNIVTQLSSHILFNHHHQFRSKWSLFTSKYGDSQPRLEFNIPVLLFPRLISLFQRKSEAISETLSVVNCKKNFNGTNLFYRICAVNQSITRTVFLWAVNCSFYSGISLIVNYMKAIGWKKDLHCFLRIYEWTEIACLFFFHLMGKKRKNI